MRKMKDSGIEWIGQIPEEWKTCFVKNIANVFTGNSIKDEQKQYYEDKFDAVPYISSKDINAVLQEIDYDNGMWIKNDDDSFKRAPKESTLICIEGGSAGKKIAFTNQEVCFVNKLCCFQTNDADSKYVYYYLMSPAFTKDFFRRISGLIGGVSVGEIKKIPVVLPTSYKEQTTIATYLDRKCSEIDSIVRETEQTIEEYKKLKQSLITEVVTGKKRVAADGLSLSNEPRKMKDSGVEWIGEIPKEWEIAKFCWINYIRARLGWKGLKADEYTPTGYPFLSAFNIVNDKLDWSELNFINQERYDESPEIKLSVGDVLIVKDGAGIGKCCRIQELPMGESTVNSSLAVITPNEKLNFNYLYYYLLSNPFQKVIWLLKNGMGVPHLTQEKMHDIKLALPSKEEQFLIATYLDTKCSEIDKLIADKQTLLQELDTYKKSLIYECVTGKREVN